jgi:signal transduction histidine kinase/ActR/RegA family two-component response regulator
MRGSRGSREDQRAAFLAEAGTLIASSFDYERVLPRLARLAVPVLGDMCAIDLLQGGGAIVRMASAHVDTTKEVLVYEAGGRHGFNLSSPNGVGAAIQSRRPIVLSPVTEADLAGEALNPDQLRVLRQLGPTSWMIVPLVGREQPLGAIAFAITESRRRYHRADLLCAEVVARQTALAMEGARLSREAEAARAGAEAANRTKDEFLSTLSHELRNPLNAVSGWARMLERGQLSEEQSRQAVQIILRNTAVQVRLIDDLLDMASVVSGRMRLAVQAVDLRSVIEEAVDAVRPAADAKDIRLQAVIESPGAPVSGDPGRLQQVMGNLLSNAIKFTPKNGRVQIKLQRVNSHVEIMVSDTGEGIRADFLPYLFDRLRQGDSSSPNRSHGGLGIGLALVRHLVELHGGSVFAESPGEGQGATFVVKLPLMIAEVRQEPIARQAEPALSDLSLSGVRVVVVDNDPAAVDLISEVLTRAGGDVRGCTSADIALSMLEQWRPNLLVSDIEMPGVDGYTLIRKVRARSPEQGGKTPAVALTAFTRPEDRIRSLRAGFNIHVSKPVDPAELTAIVASLAGRAG